MPTELVRRLLVHLVADLPSSVIHHQFAADGYTEAEILEAWTEARAAGYTESTGLGRDRLTEAGKARACEVTSESQ
jgi:hypothetical protein